MARYKGFIQEKELDLPDNSGFGLRKVFSVARREGPRQFESVLYVREHLVHFEKEIMEQFWNNPNKSMLYVQGPPGCGKTCLFYLWARLRSLKEKKRVLIVQFREKASCFIWIRDAGGALWRMNKGIAHLKLGEEVNDILDKNEATPFDLCIHDGVLDGKDICSSMLSLLNTAVVNGAIKKVVHVTSLAFSLSTGGQQLEPAGPIVRLSLDSWRLQDYIEAIKCKEFAKRMKTILGADKMALDKDNEVNNEAVGDDEMMDAKVSGDSDDLADDVVWAAWTDVIETKYFFAGGSARFMFDYPLSALRGELDDYCNNMAADEWKYFTQGAVTSRTSLAVNTLMQQFAKKASPVSKYILFRAYENCGTDLVKSMKAAAMDSNNPALKGWAFELEQIDLIRSSLESPPENPEYITNNNGLSFRPHSAVYFDEEKLDEKTMKNGVVQEDGTIIWCQKWNQGCFDVAFYQNKTLVTLQFTVSEVHSLKPRFIRRLRDALLEKGGVVDKFVHVGVRELNDFRFDLDTSGTGRKGNAKDPQFTINACHSPPLVKTTVKPAVVFQAELSPVLNKVEMWELASAKKRRQGV